ncbi:MAG: N-6 DNA methylase [Methanobrevibacter sp.]|uniref:Eco57I restriction-modification methylase domain-containing protein n=1 Tax=Methanobrevibacter sp. TaxID=66852 RepID=UPI0025E496E8|nr:N-6 DNA methylase [Methanobrevibacter sp.]MBR0270885.1 N-6 DNA methylase [Methanobrevibacter sp.]
MFNFKSSKEEIEKLVQEFKENEHIYKTATFDEENTKVNFINKFFIALGWDVYNDMSIAPQYKDVEFEDTVIINGKPKAPDYCFRIGGVRKFFVEAKKPSVDIENDRKYAFQLKRYTWSGKLPVGLLTDFEELAIYEPKSAPKKTHSTSVDRIKYYHYSEYVEKWDEIYNIFSKEAVLTGKFDKFVENKHGDKKGTSSVDSEFLKTIEEWRLELARNIAIRNKELTVDELNFAVQLIIDRIIFLRIAEDRGIERYGQLKKLTELAKNEKDNYPVYEAFIELCKKADAKYNSGLFHFSEEKDISLSADTLTPGLHIDDGKLKKIIDGLYYPDCPYEFSLISTEILGNIYEQFLGKVIRLTDSHQAKVEDKPEVKKAGGVFYTPQYIVDYIVENTIGELLKGKTPNKVSELRFIDPACGSGSFLLGAYQKLLDWHLDYYSNLKQPPKNIIYVGFDGIPRLTIQEKKRILLNNIYGVDIDSQAVEVTKLSLLLKVLEDENKDVLESQQKLIQERALPYLGDNIRCGNSLIGTDILDSNDLSLEELHEINPFDWEEEFAEVFENGGFDAVIGNPPWGASFSDIELEYLKEKNSEIIVRMINSFLYFTYVFSKKLNKNGLFGMIVPDVILYQSSYLLLRQFLIKNFYISKLLNMGMNVFKGVNQPSAIIIFKNKKEYNSKIVSGNFTNISKKAPAILNTSNFNIYNQKLLDNIPSNLFITDNINDYSILEKIENISNLTIEDIIDEDKMQRGASPDYKQAFMINKEIKLKNNLEDTHVKKAVFGGSQIKRHYIDYDDTYLIYTTKKDKFSEIPNICSYIRQFKDDITCKEVKTKKHPLYSLHRPRKEKIFLKDKKIVGVITSDKLIVAVDENKLYATDGVYLFGTNEKFNPYFVTALFNSKLYTFIYRLYSLENGRILPQVKPAIVKRMPFINVEPTLQKPFIELSNKLTNLHKEFLDCKTPKEEKLLKLQIAKTDEKINRLVYELYGLTDEEIAIIEESLK